MSVWELGTYYFHCHAEKVTRELIVLSVEVDMGTTIAVRRPAGVMGQDVSRPRQERPKIVYYLGRSPWYRDWFSRGPNRGPTGERGQMFH